MTTDRELMQQALDALEQYVGVVISVNDPNDWTPKVADAGKPARIAIEALRARLAQPEQEELGEIVPADEDQLKRIAKLVGPEQQPNPWRSAAQRLGEELSTVGPDGYYNMSASEWLDWAMKHITPARIEQEPVAQPEPEPVACPYCHYSHTLGAVYFDQNCAGCVKRMTAPPQREWQGLTDEEANELTYASIAEIEAKLKEKNA